MIDILRETSWPELEVSIRSVEMLLPREGEVVHPYADATIALEKFAFSAVRTTSLYVKRQNLALQSDIAEAVAKDGHDPLEMEGGLVLGSFDEHGEPVEIGLVPPIVETTFVDGTYVLDGSHRSNRAIWSGRETFVGIHITNIRDDCPSYALPNAWDDVKIYDYTPPLHLRKKYRDPDNPRNLYRNFGPVNGSAPRLTEVELQEDARGDEA